MHNLTYIYTWWYLLWSITFSSRLCCWTTFSKWMGLQWCMRSHCVIRHFSFRMTILCTTNKWDRIRQTWQKVDQLLKEVLLSRRNMYTVYLHTHPLFFYFRIPTGTLPLNCPSLLSNQQSAYSGDLARRSSRRSPSARDRVFPVNNKNILLRTHYTLYWFCVINVNFKIVKTHFLCVLNACF